MKENPNLFFFASWTMGFSKWITEFGESIAVKVHLLTLNSYLTFLKIMSGSTFLLQPGLCWYPYYVFGVCCNLRSCWCHWSMLLWELGWSLWFVQWQSFFYCLWSVLALETTLRSVAYADPGDHVDPCGPCYLQKSYISPWSILTLSLRGK